MKDIGSEGGRRKENERGLGRRRKKERGDE